MNLSELAKLAGGELRGNDGAHVTGAAGLADSSAGDVSFLSSSRKIPEAVSSKACCILVKEFLEEINKPQIRVDDPELVFFSVLLPKFRPRPSWPKGEISPLAYVDPGATLGDGVTVMPFAFISSGVSLGPGTVACPGVFVGEGSNTGEGCVLCPNVSIMDGVTLGNRVVVHSGTVIGSDGYGYMQRDGRHIKKPQTGGVIIGDDVEIGANCAIDRATTGNTVIGAGSKLDNLVHIAHNVTIGEGALLTGQVGIAGSTTIGKYVIMAGQSGVKDHVEVADNVIIAAKSGVLSDIIKPGFYAGTPAVAMNKWLRASTGFGKLPELIKKVRTLEKRLSELENNQDKE